MKRSFLEVFVDGMNEKLFFLLIIIVQIIFIFQGFDFMESGYDAAFYSRIFSDPSTVQYNFTYWFTGILGGAWLKVFPGLGLLGLRFAGVFFTTLTFFIVYDLLKKYLHTGPLRLSLFLIVLFLTTSVKELNHDDVTSLFFVSACWFLFTGLTKEKQYMIFLAGVFISLNTFSRLMNLPGLVLVLVIWFSAYLNRHSVRLAIFQCILFVAGFITMSVFLIFMMRWMHQDGIFMNRLRMAGGTPVALAHLDHLFPVLKEYILHYAQALSIALIVLVVLWSSSAAWRRMKTDIKSIVPYLSKIKYGSLILLAIICIYCAKKDPAFWVYLFLFYAGISMIVGFLIVTGRQPKDLRLLAAVGCIMLLVVPVGSHMVLTELGKHSLWIILPVTVDFLLNIRALSSRIVVSENSRHSYEQLIDEKHMTGLRNAFIYLTLIFILSVTYYYPHYDWSGRVSMRSQVNNVHVKGIYTTSDRAQVINELLNVSARYVKREEYVLAYDCIPMYYFLTDTRPYMHNSWLELYNGAVFREELSRSFQETHICPVVIMQKRNKAGNYFTGNQNENYPSSTETLTSMMGFLKTNRYSQVWENDFFRIYVSASAGQVAMK